MTSVTVDKSLLRQAAERCRAAGDGDLLEALRHLQACFGWETVLVLLDEADANHDACWHCGDELEPEPRCCETCPASFDECEDDHCASPGCIKQRDRRERAQWLKPGTAVLTASELEQRDFLPDAIRRRNQNGLVIQAKTGHGLCYEVLHADGVAGWYDPDELTELTPRGGS